MKTLTNKYLSLFLLLFSINLNAQVNTINLLLSKTQCLIGDTLTLTINLNILPNTKTFIPLLDTIKKEIYINDHKIDTINKGDNSIDISYKYYLSVFDTGLVNISPIPIYILKNDTINDTIFTQPLKLFVQLMPIDTTKQKIYDIKPPVEERITLAEIIKFLKKKILYVLLILFVILSIAFLIYAYIRKKKNKPIFPFLEKKPDPPYIVALNRLNQLKEKRLWQKQLYKQYYTELTDILRTYLEHQFNIPALESLSSEIILYLEKNNFDSNLIKNMKALLETADMVKFAKATPLGDENDWHLKNAFLFVEQTMPKQEQLNEKK